MAWGKEGTVYYIFVNKNRLTHMWWSVILILTFLCLREYFWWWNLIAPVLLEIQFCIYSGLKLSRLKLHSLVVFCSRFSCVFSFNLIVIFEGFWQQQSGRFHHSKFSWNCFCFFNIVLKWFIPSKNKRVTFLQQKLHFEGKLQTP